MQMKLGHAKQKDITHLQMLEQRLQANPRDFDALLQKGILLYEPFHQSDQAEQILESLITQDPHNLDAYFWLAECLCDHFADYKKAEKILHAALQLDINRADCHLLFAEALLQQNKDEELIEFHYRKCIELEPSWIAPRKYLANFLYHKGDFSLAKHELEEALKYMPISMQKPVDAIQEHYESMVTGRMSITQKELCDFLQKIDERSALETKFNKS